MKHLRSLKQINLDLNTYYETRLKYKENEGAYDLYADNLLWWNDKINLISRSVSRETVREHIIHSLLPLQINILDKSEIIVDAGTGGGLPGIPLAISMPGVKFILNDIVQKKIMAVKQMVRELNLDNVEYFQGPISELREKQLFTLVSKHAFKTDDLMEMVKEKPYEKIVLYKGNKEGLSETKKTVASEGIIFNFEFGKTVSFYEGKGIIVLNR
ncbi:MAG: 16S rRNA (guanine(527)-N(7))-methyltransferase RsmG [Balneolaceae bacterium]